MKRLLIIISMICSLFACNYRLHDEELVEYTRCFENSINIMDHKCKEIYEKIEAEMNEYSGRPIATKPWYDKSLVVKTNAVYCYNLLDSLLLRFQSHTEIKKTDADMNRKNLEKLSKQVGDFKYSIIEFLDKKFDESIIKSLSYTLNTKKWPSDLYSSTNRLEQIAILTKIKTDVKSVENLALFYLYSNVGGASDFFRMFESIVIPKSETVLLGQSYVADIVLGVSDSTSSYRFEINNKISALQHDYNYKERVTIKEGTVKRNGKILLKQPRTGKDFIIPFTMEYEVSE